MNEMMAYFLGTISNIECVEAKLAYGVDLVKFASPHGTVAHRSLRRPDFIVKYDGMPP